MVFLISQRSHHWNQKFVHGDYFIYTSTNESGDHFTKTSYQFWPAMPLTSLRGCARPREHCQLCPRVHVSGRAPPICARSGLADTRFGSGGRLCKFCGRFPQTLSRLPCEVLETNISFISNVMQSELNIRFNYKGYKYWMKAGWCLLKIRDCPLGFVSTEIVKFHNFLSDTNSILQIKRCTNSCRSQGTKVRK